MKIKTRLSFQFTVIVAVILFFCSLLVFYFSFTSQRSKFRENLLNRAKNTAVLFIDVEEVDSMLLKKIHQTTISFKDEEIVVADSALNVLYNNNVDYLTEDVLKSHIGKSQYNFFSAGEKDCVSYKHSLNSRSFYIFVAAYDLPRKENLSSLRSVLFWSILFSLWLAVYASYLFSKRAIKPIAGMIQNIKKINSARLGERLDEGKRRDEIEQLSITFNEMLADLESAFKNQEEFVTNASHELRTPLAVMISETDYMISKIHDKKDLELHLAKLLDDLKDLNLKSSSLLELAHLNRDTTVIFSDLRIDEVIYSSILKIKAKYPGRKILSKVEYTENENDLIIRGNSGLLEIAFKNILDNACKFSTGDINVEIRNSGNLICISVSDRGIGIPYNELDSIFQPFRRAANAKYISGFGVGLSLVSRIINIHNAYLDIKSNQNVSTTVEITFNNIRSE